MEKRTYDRMPVGIDARFFCGKMFYSGTVFNLSAEGMHISTKKCFPLGTSIVVIFCHGKDLLQVNTKVKRLTRTNGCYCGMGIEILKPSKKYLNYVDSLSPVCMV